MAEIDLTGIDNPDTLRRIKQLLVEMANARDKLSADIADANFPEPGILSDFIEDRQRSMQELGDLLGLAYEPLTFPSSPSPSDVIEWWDLARANLLEKIDGLIKSRRQH
jgi:hypothetical protein